MSSPPPWVARALPIAAAIGLIAATVIPRVLGLDAGLPRILNEDERVSAGFARTLLAGGDLGGSAWRYPPLLGELMALLAEPARWLGACEGRCDDLALIRIGRGLSVIAATIAVLAVDAAARLAGVRRSVAFTLALALAWSPTLAMMSRYATPDALCVAFVALALLAVSGLQRGGGRRWVALAGAAIGLAAGAKYNAGVVAIAVAAALALTPPAIRQAPRLLAAAALALAAFGLTLLWPWSGAEVVLEGLRYEWWHYGRGHGGFTTDAPLRDALAFLAAFAFGVGPTIAAGLGLARAALPGDPLRRRVPPLAIFVAAYLILIGRGQMFVDRLLLPILPALALLAAFGVDRLVDLAARRGRRAAGLAGVALAALLCGPSLRGIVLQVRALGPVDSRLAADRWIREHLGVAGASVVAVPRSAGVLVQELPHAAVRVLSLEDALGFRWRNANHVVVGRGAFDRYLRSPERFADEAAQVIALRERLESIAVEVVRFDNPPLPGAERFGATAPIFHQSAVDIYVLRRLPGPRAP
ncbi:MAG: glycosyltransferase family 39 protein [Nannocystaceae bacterium]